MAKILLGVMVSFAVAAIVTLLWLAVRVRDGDRAAGRRGRRARVHQVVSASQDRPASLRSSTDWEVTV